MRREKWGGGPYRNPNGDREGGLQYILIAANACERCNHVFIKQLITYYRTPTRRSLALALSPRMEIRSRAATERREMQGSASYVYVRVLALLHFTSPPRLRFHT